MQFAWLLLAIVASVGYHLVLKVTPSAVNPLLSLAVTYAIGAAAFLGCYALVPDTPPIRDAVRLVNWTAPGLAITVIAIDVAFLLLYRSGFEVALGLNITQAAAALILVAIGVFVFREKITAVNVAGIVLCIVGLWLISRR
jgi:multidrug transporter EmrE-like cation transporter